MALKRSFEPLTFYGSCRAHHSYMNKTKNFQRNSKAFELMYIMILIPSSLPIFLISERKTLCNSLDKLEIIFFPINHERDLLLKFNFCLELSLE